MTIQKILDYDIYAGTSGTARYLRVCSLLNQTIDPDTLYPDTLDCFGQSVLTSPRKRAQNCIKKSSAKSITPSLALNEIAFELKEFCTEENFLQHGSTAVRAAFVQAFIMNRLAIPHTQLQSELKEILAVTHQSEITLRISHTFRIKMIEIYSIIGDELFNNPSLIKDYLDTEKHLFAFGEKIEV